MSTMDLGEAQLVTIVYATPDGPRVTDIALADRELAPGDPRQPGDIIMHDAGFGRESWVAVLETAARVIRGAS